MITEDKMTASNQSSTNKDTSKWDDIKKEFSFSASKIYNKDTVTPVAAASLFMGMMGGQVVSHIAHNQALGYAIAGGSMALAMTALAGVVATEALHDPRKGPVIPRPNIEKLGYAFCLAAPLAIGGGVGTAIYNHYDQMDTYGNAKVAPPVTAQADAKCGHDAVAKEIKRLESTGIKLTLDCK
jgi:hypothetical protein